MSKELDTCREFSKAQIAELESLREQVRQQAEQLTFIIKECEASSSQTNRIVRIKCRAEAGLTGSDTDFGSVKDRRSKNLAYIAQLQNRIAEQAARIKELETQRTSDGIVIFQLDSALRLANEKWVAQAAVIEKLIDAVKDLLEFSINSTCGKDHAVSVAQDALATPGDSKQILAEWIDKVLGEPAGEVDDTGCYSGMSRIATLKAPAPYGTKLFKKPEIK